MTFRRLQRDVLLHQLREMRTALVIAGLLVFVFGSLLAWQLVNARRYDPFGSRRMGDDTICRTYGEGGRVCFPAPEAASKYRAEQKKRLADGQ